MPDQPAYCDACGLVREGPDVVWYTVHFGISDPSLMIHASDADLRRLGERHACSRECLIKLVLHWTEDWQVKKRGAVA
ncbi:MAG TPA: hypothetical protein VH601_06305 [Bryobacteraceae bacterium]|jgi:hypothetical protein